MTVTKHVVHGASVVAMLGVGLMAVWGTIAVVARLRRRQSLASQDGAVAV